VAAAYARICPTCGAENAPDVLRCACYLRFDVDDTPGVLAQVASALADRSVSVAQVVQHPAQDGMHIVILTHSAPEGDVRAYCEANLTGYKRPKVVEFRKDLPKTPVGKVLRRELRDTVR